MKSSALRGTESDAYMLLRTVPGSGSLPGGDDAVPADLRVVPGRSSGADSLREREAVREQIRWAHHQRAVRRARRMGRSI